MSQPIATILANPTVGRIRLSDPSGETGDDRQLTRVMTVVRGGAHGTTGFPEPRSVESTLPTD